MLNSPLPPDVDVTQRLQSVIAGWKGAHHGYRLDRLFQDCLDLVGPDKHLLPLKVIPVHALDSTSLEKALRHYRFPLDYGVGTIGRFESALVPVLRESGPAAGFLFVYEEDLRTEDQVALFAHAVGHLLINHQQRLAERLLDLDPDEGQTHTDRLAELRYLDISENRNYLDRKVLESFPTLTKLIELPEESAATQHLATRHLTTLLRRQGWVNQYVNVPYRYTQGRVIPDSTHRGKRSTVDALLRVWSSVPTAVVHAQRSEENLEEAIRRVRTAAQLLCVPFAYVFTQQQEVIELDWLSGTLSDPRLLTTLPTREELQTRWLSALRLNEPKAKDVLSYPYQPAQTPRYYQEAAINQAIIATLLALRGLRQRRILLTLATGTGKTQVAFQILWKLKKTYQVRNVLFLADRGYLLDQAQTNTFGPFRDAITRGMGTADTAHDILFGTYQWLANSQEEIERYKAYPPDYFDVIVIDECHRGSAEDDSNWRKVLEYFEPAVQIGLTATPLNTDDVKTKAYYGESVYTYSLSQGINDGYLAPYRVRRIEIGKTGPVQKTHTKTPRQTLDQQIVMQTGATMRQYTQTIAEHLASYLRQQSEPRTQKTIVFCVDNTHADQMRIALEKACADWARPGDIARIVDDDGQEGKRTLSQFCTIRERQPVIVTTARLLSTGVDVPTCKNIVLARGVGSLVEFKQIIGRGTRLSLPEKGWFTILDYAGAIKHFFDPVFDGDPTSIGHENLVPTPTSTSTTAETERPATSVTTSEPGAPEQPQREQTAMPSEETTVSREQEAFTTEPLTTEGPAAANWQLNAEHYESPQELKRVQEGGQTLQEQDRQQPTSEPASIGVTYDTQAAETVTTEARTSEPGVPEQYSNNGELATAMAGGATGSAAPAIPDKPIKNLPPRATTSRADTKKKQREQPAPEVLVGRESGRRFEVIGDTMYELDAHGRIREGSCRDFIQPALENIIKTPEELREHWINARQALIEQLANEVVALDALAIALKQPEVDHYDLLRHILFQQPTITRAERVQRLRAEHSTFFQRFEHNPLAKGLLDAILDKYVQETDSIDVSNIKLLEIEPIKQRRTLKEWMDVFKEGPIKWNVREVLKELQQLLYSV